MDNTLILRCPVATCTGALTDEGEVFIESGEYDEPRGTYEAEGNAAVYRCERGHYFAFDPPIAKAQ